MFLYTWLKFIISTHYYSIKSHANDEVIKLANEVIVIIKIILMFLSITAMRNQQFFYSTICVRMRWNLQHTIFVLMCTIISFGMPIAIHVFWQCGAKFHSFSWHSRPSKLKKNIHFPFFIYTSFPTNIHT